MYKLCKYCGQPMKPKNVRKRPNEYDHAQGCPYSRARPPLDCQGIDPKAARKGKISLP